MSLAQELAELLNAHSCENDSGTPDYILAHHLIGTLNVYNETVAKRAEWRGELVELPALQSLNTKKVPLVTYENGRSNEIGTAEVEIWPGEIHVEGTIVGTIPVFHQLDAAYSLAETKRDPV